MSGLAERFGWRRGWGGTRLPSVTLLTFLVALLAIGILFVHSATVTEDVGFPSPVARNHILRVAFGFSFLVLFLVLHYRILEDLSIPLYLVGIALLVYLLARRAVTGDVERWIRLFGFFNLQPSELIKLFTVILLARVLKPAGRTSGSFDHLVPLGIVAFPLLLVALQPDLGTALVLPPILLAMLWTAGISTRRLLLYVAIGLLVVPIAWFGLHDYQRQRLLVFMDPFDPALAEASYQVRQSMTAIGSGGLTGMGYLEGNHKVLGYLPEDHNDFIFAVIGEEWGLAGTLGVTALFFLLFASCYGIAFRTREPFGRLLVVGITTQLAFQTFINLAMTTGLAPVTGLPLPFVSFGGSSLLGSLASIGIVIGVGMRPVRIIHPDGLMAGTSHRR